MKRNFFTEHLVFDGGFSTELIANGHDINVCMYRDIFQSENADMQYFDEI